MYQVDFTSKFKQEYKKAVKQGFKELVDEVIEKLSRGEILEKSFQDHELKGDYKGFRECHVKPDLLLIYKKNQKFYS